MRQQTMSKLGKKFVTKWTMMLAVLALALPLSVIGSASATSNTLALSALVEEANYRIFNNGNQVILGDFTNQEREFVFTTPGVNSLASVLHLRVQGVQCPNNTITINGTAVSNALVIRDADELDDFHSEIGIVPGGVLNAAGNNTLRITSGFCVAPDRDEFTVDNLVLVYRQP